MKVLIACEESQEVCKAFRARGHEAYSCDIQECSGGHPEWHIIEDVTRVLSGGFFDTQLGIRVYVVSWDLMIAHPPCTYLSNMGAVHLFRGKKLNQERYQKGLAGKEFFLKLLNASIPKICVENPIPSTIFNLPRHTQEIHPYHFGHTFKKATRLWLKGGLKPLMPTNIVWKRGVYVSANKGNTVANGCVNSAKERSKTFPGIAKAMAEQWG